MLHLERTFLCLNPRSSEYITVHLETVEAVFSCPANTCLAQKGSKHDKD